MKSAVVLFVAAMVLVAISASAAKRYSLFEAADLIEREYQENKLTLDEKCLYLALALRGRTELPQRFRFLTQEESKCGTPLILEIRRNWDRLSPETQQEIDRLLDRPVKPFTYRTTNFVIHYDTAGEYPVYNPWEDVDPADGVPDYVNRVGDYMERSWYVEIDSMGYYAPPFDGTEGGDSLYDVYIDLPYGYAFYGDPSSQYPDRPYAVTSYIIIGNDLRIPRYPDDPLPFCKATCAHELFHACQFVFTGQIGIYPEDYTSWLYESSANWIEESVWDELNDVYYYLNDYLPVSEKSLYHEDGRHMYASWIWNQYLSENYGRDILHSIWLRYMDAYACWAVNSVLVTLGTNMDDQFREFAVWNWFTNYRDDGNHYSEGAFFPPDTVVYVAAHSSYPISGIIDADAAEGLGANYILFQPALTDTGTYKLVFAGLFPYVFGVDLILRDYGGQYSYLRMDLDWHQSGELLIPDFQSLEKVIMVVTRLFDDPDHWEPVAYYYSLESYPSWIRGDANGDRIIDLADAIYLLNYLFKGDPPPDPLEAGDCNCDGAVELGDAIYLLNYLFKNGPPPCE